MNSGDRKPGETQDVDVPEDAASPAPTGETGAPGGSEGGGEAPPLSADATRRDVEDAEEVAPQGGDEAARTPPAADDRAEPVPAAAMPEPAPQPAPAPAERQGSGFAAKALAALVLLIAGAAAAIWGAPKIAPMLPPDLAAMITPAGKGVSEEALAEVEDRLSGAISGAASLAQEAVAAAAAATGAEPVLPKDAADRIAALEQAVAALRSAAAEPAPAPAADPALAERVSALESAVAALQVAPASSGAAPAGDSGDVTGAIAQLGDDIGALQSAVADAASGSESANAAASAASADVAALKARVDTLATAIAAVEQTQQDAKAAMASVATAEAAAENARRNAQASAALAAIDRAMTLGQPFPDALATARETVSVAPPPALEAAAQSGAPTREALKASFPDAAYQGIRAALEAENADQGPLAGLAAALQARVTGLPEEEVAGDSAQAKLSRARVALLKGELDRAISIIEALPPQAQQAMSHWTDGARLRANADEALATWRAEIGRAE